MYLSTCFQTRAEVDCMRYTCAWGLYVCSSLVFPIWARLMLAKLTFLETKSWHQVIVLSRNGRSKPPKELRGAILIRSDGNKFPRKLQLKKWKEQCLWRNYAKRVSQWICGASLLNDGRQVLQQTTGSKIPNKTEKKVFQGTVRGRSPKDRCAASPVQSKLFNEMEGINSPNAEKIYRGIVASKTARRKILTTKKHKSPKELCGARLPRTAAEQVHQGTARSKVFNKMNGAGRISQSPRRWGKQAIQEGKSSKELCGTSLRENGEQVPQRSLRSKVQVSQSIVIASHAKR